ncbi:hypothetical protein HanHA89_Chr11g0450411 [Helianthus annuus]|nr:hypothetical protein HanHA89_Chr11g0450411 [Helianthus annuus]
MRAMKDVKIGEWKNAVKLFDVMPDKNIMSCHWRVSANSGIGSTAQQGVCCRRLGQHNLLVDTRLTRTRLGFRLVTNPHIF